MTKVQIEYPIGLPISIPGTLCPDSKIAPTAHGEAISATFKTIIVESRSCYKVGRNATASVRQKNAHADDPNCVPYVSDHSR